MLTEAAFLKKLYNLSLNSQSLGWCNHCVLIMYVKNWILWHIIISSTKFFFLLKARRGFTGTERSWLRSRAFPSLSTCKFQMKCAQIYSIPWPSLPKGIYAVLRILYLAVWFYKDFLFLYSLCEPLLDRQLLLQVVIYYFSRGKLFIFVTAFIELRLIFVKLVDDTATRGERWRLH